MSFTAYEIVDGQGDFQTALFFTAAGTATAANSMPVALAGPSYVASSASVVASTFGATGTSAAFYPDPGRAFNIEVWNPTSQAPGYSLGGTVYLGRKTAGGSLILPLTGSGVTIMSFTTTTSEQWSDDQYGVAYYLVCTAWTTTIDYRITP